MRNLTPILFVWILTGSIAAADGPPTKPIEAKPPDRPEPVSYALEVADILAERCVGCHGSALAENRLSLEDVPSMLKGGKRGAALVPGKSAESLLFQMAAHQLEPVMPPADRPGNPPLSPEELGLLKRWIDEGAIDDSESIAESGHRRPTEVVLGPLPPTIQPIYAVDLSTAGLVAAGRANRVPVYDLDSGLLLTELGGHQDLIQSVRFSPDGRLLAAASFQIVTLWRVPGVEERKSYQGHGGPVLSLCLSEDRTTLFSGGQDSTIRCWNLANGKLQWTLTRHAPVTALALKDRTLAAGFADGSIHLISVDECREWAVLTGHQASVEDLTWLPGDGERLRVASVSADGTGRIWKLPCAVPLFPEWPSGSFVSKRGRCPSRAHGTSPGRCGRGRRPDHHHRRGGRHAPVLECRRRPASRIPIQRPFRPDPRLGRQSRRQPRGNGFGGSDGTAFQPGGWTAVAGLRRALGGGS
jgi:mono/diheme cytochrome c family protein